MSRKKNALHLLLFAVEALLLSVALLYPVFSGIKYHVSDRTFARAGDQLRFRFAPEQEDLLQRIRSIRIYYTSRDIPGFDDYYKTKADSFLSEKFAFNIEYDPESPDKEYAVAVPAGLFDFRMDFYFKEAHPDRCDPPKIAEMSVGDRKVKLDQFVSRFFNLKTISFPFYFYHYTPSMGGYTHEFVGSCVILWALLMAGIVLFVIKGRPEKK